MSVNEQMDLLALMELFECRIEFFLKSKIEEIGPIEIQVSSFALFIKPTDETRLSCHGSSFSKVVLISLNDDDFYVMTDKMVSTLQVFYSSGSGFIVESIEHLDINISNYKSVKGSSYILLR